MRTRIRRLRSPGAPVVWRALGLLALGLLFGCASTPSVLPDPGPGEPPQERLSPEEKAVLRARFEGVLDEVEAARAAGESHEAMRRIEEALAENPPQPWRAKLLQARMRIRNVMLHEEVVEGRIVIDAPEIIIRETARVRVRVTNLGTEEVTIPYRHRTPSGGRDSRGSSSMVVLRIQYRDWDHRGSTVEQETTRMLPLESDVRIAPGETWEHVLDLSTDDPLFRPDLVVYRRVRISGRLQPVEIRVGGTRWFAPVELAAGTFEIFPGGIEPIAESPEATLARALELSEKTPRALNHVFFAAILLHRVDPRGALRHLVEALASPSADVRETAQATLSLVSGREDLEGREAWESYLSEEQPDR